MQTRRALPVYQQDGPLGIFKDSQADELFRSKGVVKFTAFSAEEAADLRVEAAALMAVAAKDIATSVDLTSVFAEPEEKRKAHEWVMARIADRCLAQLNDYKVAQAGISRKPAGADQLQAHVAWTLMRDTKTIGVTAWVALEDVDITNGAMRFSEGSHGLAWPAWGPSLDLMVLPHLPCLEPTMTTYTVKAGEGFLFDSYLPHGSTASSVERDRLGIRIQMIPQEAEGVVHSQSKTDPDLIDIYPSDAAHLANLSFEQLKGNDFVVEPIESYPRSKLHITQEGFLQAVENAEAIRSGERDFASFMIAPAVTPDNGQQRSPSPTPLLRLRAYAGRIKRGIRRRAGMADPGATL